MKKNILIAVLAATTLIACKNEDKDNELMDDNAMETEVVVEEEIIEPQTTAVVYDETKAADFQRDFAEAVTVKDKKVVKVADWAIYTDFNTDYLKLRSAKPATRITAAQKLRADFNQLRESLPEYMNLRRVRRAIDKIDVRIEDYEKEAAKADVNEKALTRDLDRIGEAYSNLGEQIVKAREQYIDNKEDAIEEYLEEINDLDKNKTTEERYRDAREEYDEEMDQK